MISRAARKQGTLPFRARPVLPRLRVEPWQDRPPSQSTRVPNPFSTSGRQREFAMDESYSNRE